MALKDLISIASFSTPQAEHACDNEACRYHSLMVPAGVPYVKCMEKHDGFYFPGPQTAMQTLYNPLVKIVERHLVYSPLHGEGHLCSACIHVIEMLEPKAADNLIPF